MLKPELALVVVFPTPVGVFLSTIPSGSASDSLPHARGGVSCFDGCKRLLVMSSPRPWGCFRFAMRSVVLH